MQNRLTKAVDAFNRAFGACGVATVPAELVRALGKARPAELKAGMTLDEVSQLLTPMARDARDAVVSEVTVFAQLKTEAPHVVLA
jgi:hypothetical protein